MSKELRRTINKLQKERQDLLVLIDTLQSNLHSVSSYLTQDQLKSVLTKSYKWCLNWRDTKDER